MDQDNILLGRTIDAIRTIVRFNPEDLIREDELGVHLAFHNAVEPARKIINFYKLINIENFNLIPEEYLALIYDETNRALSALGRIKNFQVADVHNRVQYIDSLTNVYQENFRKLFPIISFTQSFSEENFSEKKEKEINETIKEINQKNAIFNRIEKELYEKIEIINKQAGDLSVARNAKYFNNESKLHKTKSCIALLGAITLSLILFVFLMESMNIIFTQKFSHLDNFDKAQISFTKAAMVSILIYAIVISVRVFNASNHNAVINRHRANALETYKTIVDAGTDANVRNTILSHAASCIFAPQETGFTKSGGDIPNINISPSLLNPPK